MQKCFVLSNNQQHMYNKEHFHCKLFYEASNNHMLYMNTVQTVLRNYNRLNQRFIMHLGSFY